MKVRSKLDIIRGIWKRQGRSKLATPTYSEQELIEWFLLQPHLNLLYDNWVASDCNNKLVPSVGRINHNQGYSLNNLELHSFAYINLKSRKYLKRGKS